MASATPHLDWAVIRLGEDLNWWVEEVSNPVEWDVDSLGIIDPRQMTYILECCEPFRDYGFDFDVLERAFFTFRIEEEMKDTRVRLRRVRASILSSDDDLFALPDILDEEKGPYADLLGQITRFRVKLLNDLIDFDQNLTIEELEEEIRERQNQDYMESQGAHFFTELCAILEYIPEGYEAELDEEEIEMQSSLEDEEEIGGIPEFEDENENIEEDETMKWEEETAEDEKQFESLEDLEDDDEEEIEEEKKKEPKPRRGRPRKR